MACHEALFQQISAKYLVPLWRFGRCMKRYSQNSLYALLYLGLVCGKNRHALALGGYWLRTTTRLYQEDLIVGMGVSSFH